jgi:AmmeMemoRadiSam system protein B
VKAKNTFVYLFTFILLSPAFIQPQEIRPIRDEIGYCWQADEFDLFINWLGEQNLADEFESENLIAGISPHDDYLYAGKVYYPLYKLINAKEVVIFGVTHGTVRRKINDTTSILIFDEFNRWKGPYKDVEISFLREIIKSQLDAGDFLTSNMAQSLEHSIEGLIPFLQHYNKDVKITPIMVTRMSFGKMDSLSTTLAEIISGYIESEGLGLGEDIFFLMSNDANHYGADFNNYPYGLDQAGHQRATEYDKKIADDIFNGTVTTEKIENLANELWPEAGMNKFSPLWCGRYPLVFGLLTINKVVSEVADGEITCEVFTYSDTWTEGVLPFNETHMGITAPFSLRHWVGFLSAGFYLK